ncbi:MULTISPECIES: hypothetical protein [unclassified Ekhidna]|jgi:hypothetical protein|uniref:hypothetical protein n=1 Tax=unclassified Ekhidna TaxID=2632188 RepID=UPI0032DF58D2
MQTIRLQVSDKIYSRLIESLQKLRGEDLTIIDEDEHFLANQKEARDDYNLMKEGKTAYLNLDEFERRLMTDE